MTLKRLSDIEREKTYLRNVQVWFHSGDTGDARIANLVGYLSDWGYDRVRTFTLSCMDNAEEFPPSRSDFTLLLTKRTKSLPRDNLARLGAKSVKSVSDYLASLHIPDYAEQTDHLASYSYHFTWPVVDIASPEIMELIFDLDCFEPV